MTQRELFDVGTRLPLYVPGKCTPARIGSGPKGKTCRDCKHYRRFQSHVLWVRKCGLMEAVWTHGPGTDIKAGWAACSEFEERSDE